MKNEMDLFQRSEQYLWTDDHISKEMLKSHLDRSHEGASRKKETVEKTVEWISTQLPEKGRILDLGCGPGFYTTLLEERGFKVTGIDINAYSITYAIEEAEKRDVVIDYQCLDYLKEDIGSGYDAVMMIYCDFGALIPSEQRTLLEKIKKALKPGGVFIFDVFGEGLNGMKEELRTWEYETEPDFWGNLPRFVLGESTHFAGEKVWGDRHIVLEQEQEPREYITWDQYYTQEEMEDFLGDHGFETLRIANDLIPLNDKGEEVVLFVVSTPEG